MKPATMGHPMRLASGPLAPRVALLGLGRTVVLATWFALAGGLVEVAILAVRQHLLGTIIYRNPHYVWMSPVGGVIVFAASALALRLLSLRWPALASVRVILLALTFLALLGWILLPGWIHGAAAVLLAAGGSLHVSAWLARRWSAFRSVVDQTLPALAAVVMVLFAAATLLPRVRERRILRTHAAAPAAYPNVLLIILDTVRANSLSLYSYARPTTPELERVAEHATVFDRAIAPASWTLPSHASMFTGHWPHDLDLDEFSPLGGRYPTLAETLTKSGYATAGFVANLYFADYEHGLGRGFARWMDYPVSLGQILNNSFVGRHLVLKDVAGFDPALPLRVAGVQSILGGKRAPDVSAAALEWLERERDRPYFVVLNYMDAHGPYVPPKPFLGRYGPLTGRSFPTRLRERFGVVPYYYDPEREATLRTRYEESITYLDSEVGILLRSLEVRGLLENTVVVITSDHGEEFGEHRRYLHQTDVYFTQVHVPLLISFPGHVPEGRRVEIPVSLRDLGATILDLTGVANPDSIPGRSLASSWKSGSAPSSVPVLSTLQAPQGTQASITTGRYQYLRLSRGQERLYDYTTDPEEQQDLSGTPAGEAQLPAFREQLRSMAPSIAAVRSSAAGH